MVQLIMGLKGSGKTKRLVEMVATAVREEAQAMATLEQVAHLLRHASPATTAVYAKTDLSRLGTLARPWPLTGNLS